MIIVRLNGGLGNQLFQYATARAIAISNNTTVLLDVDEFKTHKLRQFELDKYKVDAEIYSSGSSINNVINPVSFVMKTLKKLRLEKSVKNYHFERGLSFNGETLKLKDGSYLEGYFQSEKYFHNIRNTLLEEIVLKQGLSDYVKYNSRKILSAECSVSLHIRRGDYVLNENTNATHGVCDLRYYYRAINYFKKKLTKFTIFVFSDDIDWAVDNLSFENIVFVKSSMNNLPHDDIYLMSKCKHNIIANSSFSWWGAWLNNNDDKIVIAPSNWFIDHKLQNQSQDIVPCSWKIL